MTESVMKDALEDFGRTIEEGAARLLSIPETESETRKAEGKWSVKETLGHLIDSAANNHARFVTGQLKDDMVFNGYEQEAWVALQHYQQASWHALVNLWKAYNLHLLHVASNIPPERLKQSCHPHTLHKISFQLVDEKEPATLEYLIRDYIEHMKHHLNQIFGEQGAKKSKE